MADFGLNEPSNTIGDLLPLLYFSQSLEQTKLRNDQNMIENRRQNEAMALRQRQVQESEEQHALQKATLFSQIADDLPDKERLQGVNDFIRKPFGLPAITDQDVQKDSEAIRQFKSSLQTETDPVKQRESFRGLLSTLSSPQARREAGAIGREMQGQQAAEAILPIPETATPEEAQDIERKRGFVAQVGAEKQVDIFKALQTSQTANDTQAIRRVTDLRQKITKGLANERELIEEATLSAAQKLPAYDRLTQAHTNAIGRGMVADRFLGSFAKEVERVDRGLAPMQKIEEGGGFTLPDALNERISSYEHRGIEDLSLTETYDLQHLKDQRTSLQTGILKNMGITGEQRDQAVQKIRQDLAAIEPAIKTLKTQKGIPGAESQLHAYEAVQEAWKAQATALLNPTSEAVGKLTSTKNRMVKEQAFWGEEKVKSEKEAARLLRARMKQGTDQQLRAQAEKEAVAQGQQELAALPKDQQTSQSAGRIAKRISDETGVSVQVDDVMKAGKDPNAPLIRMEQKQETTEAQVVGKGFGEQYVETQKAGSDALGKIARFERMESLLQGVETGKLTPAMTEIAAVGQALGIEVDKNLPAKQALTALSNEIALQLRNPSGGAGMPGALSDKDREFLLKMTPGLGTTPEGNRLIIETGKSLAKRDQEVALMARQYRKKHGHLDEGFYDELGEYSAKHPLFKDRAAPKGKADAGGYVEIRTTKDGRRLGKKADGTIEVVP